MKPCYVYVRESDALPALYATENTPNPIAKVKLFDPCGSWTWYIVEYDPTERLCFGLVDGFEKELGYFSLAELEEVRHNGLAIERDLHFKPTPVKTLQEGSR